MGRREARLAKLPTLLQGLAFAKFELLTIDEENFYAHAKGKMIGRFCPREERIDAKRQFKSRILRMSKDLDAFVYDLELLHSRAWPEQGKKLITNNS